MQRNPLAHGLAKLSGLFYDNEVFAFCKETLEEMQRKYDPDPEVSQDEYWHQYWSMWENKAVQWGVSRSNQRNQKNYVDLCKCAGRMLEFQESDPEQSGGPPRQRLSEYNVALEELQLGQRTLFPVHLPSHFHIFCQLMMAIFEPVPGQTLIASVDFEGDSMSINANGIPLNIVYRLDSHFAQKFQRIYGFMGFGSSVAGRDEAVKDVINHCLFNRHDIIVLEDGPLFLYEMDWWILDSTEDEPPKYTFNGNAPEDPTGYHVRPDKSGMFLLPTAEKHGGDLATLLHGFSKTDRDFICTVCWPKLCTDEGGRMEFKNLKHRNAMYWHLKETGALDEGDECTVLI